jgi:hypothetical protein
VKRQRIDLRGLLQATCPACDLPCWLHPVLGWLHRLPKCRWFDEREHATR